MPDETGDVAELPERHGMRAQSSSEELVPLVREVLDQNPGPGAQYQAGKTATLAFLLGQGMKKSGGQRQPQVVQTLVKPAVAPRAAGPRKPAPCGQRALALLGGRG